MNEFEERLSELFAAMEARGYDAFFNGDREKAVGALHRHLDNMSSYIDAVYAHESAEAAMVAGAGEEARDELERLDGVRTSSHNAAMDSLNIVNRIFDAYGLEPFTEVAPSENRSDIGEKIAAYVSVMFLDSDEGLSRSEAARLAHDAGLVHSVRSEALSKILKELSHSECDTVR